ncbi:hypothetical protein BC5_0006 [Bacillus phage BC-5]|uniref:Uncharacterized protein n=1 Tax=Bacillus phage BC-5 TaxID=3020389 RepID=A0AAF0BTC6_9CAUD|nr:hypothetical protein BC5_0006 [Bacillus phage BC-5]
MKRKFYIDTDMVSGVFIKEEDYLKVVEERQEQSNLRSLAEERMEKLEKQLKNKTEQYEKEKEKHNETVGESNNYYVKAERLDKENKFHNNEFKRLGQYILNNNYQNGKLLIVDSIIAQCEKYNKENQGLSIRCESLEEEVGELEEKLIKLTSTKTHVLNRELEDLLNVERQENKRLKDKIHFCNIEGLTKYMSKNYPMFAGMQVSDVVISLLENLKEEQEDTYTLSYSYLSSDGVTIKNYRQSGLLKEEYEEMYGMDSDNWLSHSLVKDRKEVL